LTRIKNGAIGSIFYDYCLQVADCVQLWCAEAAGRLLHLQRGHLVLAFNSLCFLRFGIGRLVGRLGFSALGLGSRH
jgi:hypothetical protein